MSSSGSHATLRWREPDSNPRSPHRGEPFRDRAGTWSFGVPGCFLNTQTDSAENGPRDPRNALGHRLELADGLAAKR